MATTLPVQRHPRSLFPEFSELFAAFRHSPDSGPPSTPG